MTAAAAVSVTGRIAARLRSTQARSAMRAHARAKVASACRACGEATNAQRSTRRYCAAPCRQPRLSLRPKAGSSPPSSPSAAASESKWPRGIPAHPWRPSTAARWNRSHTPRRRRSSAATSGSARCRRGHAGLATGSRRPRASLLVSSASRLALRLKAATCAARTIGDRAICACARRVRPLGASARRVVLDLTRLQAGP